MRHKILPAIIAETQRQLDEALEAVEGFAQDIMLDIMDGRFVPARSLDFDFATRDGPSYQAHLMVEDSTDYIEGLIGKVDTVVIHVEALDDVRVAAALFREAGLGVFFAVNPGTPIEAVTPYTEIVDGVLVMTVQPGRYGAPFLPACLEKVSRLRRLEDDLVIEVDGGMNPRTARMAAEAGADWIASGSYIMKSGDTEGAYMRLVDAAEGAHRGRSP